MKLVFLGPPGAGKGTQAERLCKRFNLVHISTGDMLRAEISAETEIGKLAAKLINNGEFVPDNVVIEMVQKKLEEEKQANGFVFDGFPRTVNQAELLADKVKIDLVVNIDVPLFCLLDRIMHRRICNRCNGSFYIEDLGNEKCPVCGNTLTIRKDDNPEVFEERYRIYTERTMPIIDFYEHKNCIVHIDGNRDIDLVQADVANAVLNLKNGDRND